MAQMTRRGWIAGLVALVFAGTVVAQTEVPNINKRGNEEKKFVEEVTVALFKNIRTSIKEPKLIEYKAKEVSKDRLEWSIKGSYKGGLTGKLFTAEITIKIDTNDKDKWEVTTIDYKDDNTVTGQPKLENIEKFKKALNGK